MATAFGQLPTTSEEYRLMCKGVRRRKRRSSISIFLPCPAVELILYNKIF
jgi:hypothetical protein